jgi:Kef-type K+ transport system membrane component KefB
MVARILSGWSGGILTGLSHRESALTGLALMPQAGIAIGMALVASNQFPIYKDQILVITLSSTIIFEIIGPICTQYALSREQQQS